MNDFKCCAVCGTRVKSNVKLVWNRDSDNKFFSVCCLCAEQNKVNAKSVDNFADGILTDYTPPKGSSSIPVRITEVRKARTRV